MDVGSDTEEEKLKSMVDIRTHFPAGGIGTCISEFLSLFLPARRAAELVQRRHGITIKASVNGRAALLPVNLCYGE